MTQVVQCRATRANGEPCLTKFGLSTDGLCMSHDPERQARAAQMRAEGGRAAAASKRARREAEERAKREAQARLPGAPREAPDTIEEATRQFAWLYFAGANGQLEPNVVRECANALKGFTAAAEKRDMQRRMKAMQRVVDKVKKCPSCADEWAAVRGPTL